MTARRSRKSSAETGAPKAPAAGPAAASEAAPAASVSDGLERRLGRRFERPELLELALTHRSFAYEARGGGSDGPAAGHAAAPDKSRKNRPGADNEQLEFLGDAILGLCVAEALYREFPQCTEGELTRMRAALVSRARMAEMGLALELDKHLLLGRSAEQNGGRRKPALLANAAEAVIAAVYLDAGPAAGGGGLKAVCELVEQHLLAPEREAMRQALAGDAHHGALRDHKTLLQERVQALGAGRLRYVDVSESGPAHRRTFAVRAVMEEEAGTRVLASAEGPTKKEAQQRAAEQALASWGKAAPETNRPAASAVPSTAAPDVSAAARAAKGSA